MKDGFWIGEKVLNVRGNENTLIEDKFVLMNSLWIILTSEVECFSLQQEKINKSHSFYENVYVIKIKW